MHLSKQWPFVRKGSNSSPTSSEPQAAAPKKPKRSKGRKRSSKKESKGLAPAKGDSNQPPSQILHWVRKEETKKSTKPAWVQNTVGSRRFLSEQQQAFLATVAIIMVLVSVALFQFQAASLALSGTAVVIAIWTLRHGFPHDGASSAISFAFVSAFFVGALFPTMTWMTERSAQAAKDGPSPVATNEVNPTPTDTETTEDTNKPLPPPGETAEPSPTTTGKSTSTKKPTSSEPETEPTAESTTKPTTKPKATKTEDTNTTDSTELLRRWKKFSERYPEQAYVFGKVTDIEWQGKYLHFTVPADLEKYELGDACTVGSYFQNALDGSAGAGVEVILKTSKGKELWKRDRYNPRCPV